MAVAAPLVPMTDLTLADTNILLALARRGELSARILAKYPLLSSPQAPLISYVSEAEVRSIAARQNWGASRKNQLDFVLSAFITVHIHEPGILDAYIAIDNFSIAHGVTMGKNDLWIAATASVTTATLLTTDKDFDHLHPTFLTRDWIDPVLPKP